ncbi:MAG: sulfur transferase domain-containing protein [Verrucomicrobiota bacterium]
MSPRLYSSGEPGQKATFQELRQKGITTVISVDGAAPDVESAGKNGMTYVHLPIGYDGVPPATIVALDQVLRTTDGKILIHCHHGKHRGPAAAVIASMIEGSMSKQQALQTLKDAGTSPDYSGLWKSVREFDSVPRSIEPQTITSQADVSALADSMIRIDHAFETLEKRFAASSLKPSTVIHEAVILHEGYRDSVRAARTSGHSASLVRHLTKSQTMAGELLQSVRDGQLSHAKITHTKLKADCRACHQEFRN